MARDLSTTYSARIDMPTANAASIVAAAVGVDPELRPDDVRRQIRAEGRTIAIDLQAKDAKSLRTSVTSLYDFINVSLAAVAQFSEGSEHVDASQSANLEKGSDTVPTLTLE